MASLIEPKGGRELLDQGKVNVTLFSTLTARIKFCFTCFDFKRLT